MKRRLIAALAMALLLVATLSLPAVAATEGTSEASVTVNSVINITITDAPTAGIHFGSQTAGADYPDTDANDTTASIVVKVEADTTVNVDLQIKGVDFSNGSGGSIAIAYAKYSLTYAGAKVTMNTSYTDFTTDIAPDTSTSLWHWLTIPGGTAAGAYTSTFSYQAEAH